ncbi:hypothetical protein BTE48_08720 [Oceanospirillum multiglobuliferum]|uniref:Uncharacterized protein n=1 Tax=Oceanospirillum multiglobuliferum TaxID=64969 RepID=A0A1V4T4C0_9GAMM|nr:hypothetical protein BTE48_08720 [Oceanospirillum multiglobuliferum]
MKLKYLFKHPELKLFFLALMFLAISWPVFNQGQIPLAVSFFIICAVWLITVLLLFLMRNE